MSEELKPCPFCGGEARLLSELEDCYSVECSTCCTSTAQFNLLYDAVDFWNNRYKTTADILVSSDTKAIYTKIEFCYNELKNIHKALNECTEMLANVESQRNDNNLKGGDNT